MLTNLNQSQQSITFAASLSLFLSKLDSGKDIKNCFTTTLDVVNTIELPEVGI